MQKIAPKSMNMLRIPSDLKKTNYVQMKKNVSMEIVNLRLDVVVNDITGLTGLSIIDSVCKGETNPQKHASLRNGNCKKSEEEIAKALQNNGKKIGSDYLEYGCKKSTL